MSNPGSENPKKRLASETDLKDRISKLTQANQDLRESYTYGLDPNAMEVDEVRQVSAKELMGGYGKLTADHLQDRNVSSADMFMENMRRGPEGVPESELRARAGNIKYEEDAKTFRSADSAKPITTFDDKDNIVISTSVKMDKDDNFSLGVIVDSSRFKPALSGDKETIEAALKANPGASSSKKGAQGDHVTAYEGFLNMIVSAVDGEEAAKAPAAMFRIAKSVLPEHEDSFKDDTQQFTKMMKSCVMPRDRRKDMTAGMRRDGESEEDIAQFKNSQKYAELGIVGEAVKSLGTTLLREMQNQPDIAFASFKVPDPLAPNKTQSAVSISDASAVKQAGYGLRAMERMMDYRDNISQNPDSQSCQHFCDDLLKSGSTLAQGFATLMAGDGGDRGQARRGLDKKLGEWRKEKGNDEATPELMQEVRQFLVNDVAGVGFDRNGRDSTKEISPELAQTAGKMFQDMFDFNVQKEGRVIDRGNTAIERLEQVAARHLVIMYNAFPSMQEMPQDTQNIMNNRFLEGGVRQHEGWKDRVDLESLQQGVARNASIGENGEFRMHTAQEKMEHDSKEAEMKKQARQQEMKKGGDSR